MNLINETDYKEIVIYFTKNMNDVLKKEHRRLYLIKYHQDNKERRRLYHIKYNENRYKNNKKKIKENRENNKEHKRKYDLIYSQSPQGKKTHKIAKWKKRGLICDDYNLIYEKYLNTLNCDNCNCILTIDRFNTLTTKCMDHDHNTGLFRNILCHCCNIKIR